MAFKYSVSGLTLGFLGCDLSEEPDRILKAIKDAGYDGIDVFDNPNNRNAESLRQIAGSINLDIAEVLGAWGGNGRDLAGGNQDTRREAIEYAKGAIDYCVDLGSEIFGYCLPQPSMSEAPFSKRAVGALRKDLVEGLKQICNYAADRGVAVVIEPLNCYESYPCVMNTLDEAMTVIKELGCNNVGLQPDVFHMNIGEASITDALRAVGSHVKHFHMNETNHFSFGAGHADFEAIMRTLKEITFSGYITVYMPLITRELFNMTFRGLRDESKAVPKASIEAHLREPLEYLKRIEARIHA